MFLERSLLLEQHPGQIMQEQHPGRITFWDLGLLDRLHLQVIPIRLRISTDGIS